MKENKHSLSSLGIGPYNNVVTHHNPFLDELSGWSILIRHGDIIGINCDTPLGFMVNGDFENPPMSEVPGTLYLGCGLGSWANEHYLAMRDKSSCSLVAEKLGINKRSYNRLVREVTREDREGSGKTKNHIAQTIKDMYDLGYPFQEVHKWFDVAFSALTNRDWNPQGFFMSVHDCTQAIEVLFGPEKARRWFKRADEVQREMNGRYTEAVKYLQSRPQDFVEIETYKGKMRAYMPTEVQTNPRITHAARTLKTDILLMQGQLDFGQVGTIMQTRQKNELSLSRVLEELRRHELLSRRELDNQKMKVCGGDGTLEVCPYWHGLQAKEGKTSCTLVMSGSKSRPCAPKTILELDYIRSLFLETIKIGPEHVTVVSPGKPRSMPEFNLDKFLSGRLELDGISAGNKVA